MSKLFAKFEAKIENSRNYTSPYVFHEYPKWVKLADGSPLLVYDAEEEAAAIGNEDEAAPAAPPPVNPTWGAQPAKKGK